MRHSRSITDSFRSAESAIRDGRNEKALHILRGLARKLPNEPLFQWRIGHLLVDSEKPSQSLKYFERALQLDPSSWPAWGGLGQAYMKLGQLDKAEKALRKRLALRPRAHYYVFLAKALERKNEFDAAIESYLKALQLDPTYDEAYFNLGICYDRLGKSDEASRAFGAALRLDSSYARKIRKIRG